MDQVPIEQGQYDVSYSTLTSRARLYFIRQLEPKVDAVLLTSKLLDVGGNFLGVICREDVWWNSIQ